MDNKGQKRELMELLAMVEGACGNFINYLTSEQKEEIGSLEKWSAKDVFSHLVFWGDHFNSQITHAKKNEKVPLAGDYVDQVNDGVLFKHLHQPFNEAKEAFERSFKASVELLNGYSAGELNDKDIYEYLNGRTILERALGTFCWHIGYHLSDFYLKDGQKGKAAALQETLTEKLRVFPSWKANAIYNLACFYAQTDEKGKAITHLKNAFITRPDFIEWAKQDSDLDPLRKEPDFIALFDVDQK